MGFRINTNIAAMNAHTNANVNNRNLDSSLAKLSSGLRINTAADDASGMAIADSLRSQGSALGQAVANGNDAIGIIQIADKAMDEQLKILDTIKVKATQAAQDGQSADSRKALQADVVRLMEQLDNIGNQTSYNGQSLLNGSFTNKSFQVGAYSNQTVNASIGDTTSGKSGATRFETTANVAVSLGSAGLTSVAMKFEKVDGTNALTIESVKISTSAGTGLGALADTINKYSDTTGIRATAVVQGTGANAVTAGDIKSMIINGVEIGTITDIKANDSTGVLVAAINAKKETTGVVASVDAEGKLNLTSTDGRAMNISTTSTGGVKMGGGSFAKVSEGVDKNVIVGRLSLTKIGGGDIRVSGSTGAAGIGIISGTVTKGMAQATVNLNDLRDAFTANVASAAGANANANVWQSGKKLTAGLTSFEGAQMAMSIAESATKALDSIRADLGSVQNQLVSTVSNISVTQVNVKAAESNIRDVDFAAESANFSKFNILAQSGSYAMSQANAVQQNVLKLLQ
ncbi:MAG: flagellin B [Sulfuricurvum sp.]|nr:flagellin B [Sulfuricurvum sp.]MDD5386991.1 flagellin B [Sulfuricurvum sp.]